jgi:hypothetical protein
MSMEPFHSLPMFSMSLFVIPIGMGKSSLRIEG